MEHDIVRTLLMPNTGDRQLHGCHISKDGRLGEDIIMATRDRTTYMVRWVMDSDGFRRRYKGQFRGQGDVKGLFEQR
jgi:hypothetical protein